ncbi:flagellar biosynthetic protein FliO [Myxococcus fulvus]|uniref:FliO/MopB family protein n=1 Tax=Myxococcus fulvus TaxID=33 RepID=UPI003B9B1AB5
MAVLRTPLSRLTLGVTLLLAPTSVLAQAPVASPSPVPAVPSGAAARDAVAPPQAGQGASTAPVPASPRAAPVGGVTAPTSATPAAAPSEVAVPTTAAPSAPLEDTPAKTAVAPVWEDPSIDAAAEAEPESMGWMLVRTLMVLGAVVASIYLTLNVGLRRLMGLQSAAPGRQTVVSVVERLPLDPKRALFVVKAADEYLLVGGGEAGLQLLSKLDAEAVERIRAQRPQTNVVPLSPFLQKLLSRRSGGSSSEPPGA